MPWDRCGNVRRVHLTSLGEGDLSMPTESMPSRRPWNQLKGQIKERWGQLTDDDLQISGGNIDQFVGRIQQKTGEGREAIEKFLSELTSREAPTLSQATEVAREFA